MNKMMSLIKACAFDNLTTFKMGNKKKNKKIEKILPFLFTLLCFSINWFIAEFLMQELSKHNAHIVLLTLFILYTSVMTLIEGIYKSSGLLFNCKDDDLLLSLPISKRVVLFIRILKFYIFEMFYNSLFLLPAMIVYAKYVNVGFLYYISSIIALLMLPIIPIILSSIIGGTISAISSRFRFKTFVEIAITGGSLIAIFVIAMNFDKDVVNLVEKATNIHKIMDQWYYPIHLYTRLISNFNIVDLVLFIISNIGVLAFAIMILSKSYFKINSKIKIIKQNVRSGKYKNIVRSQTRSIMNKEIKRFISSPVYVTNSTFGLALFIIGCIVVTNKFNSVANVIVENNKTLSYDQILEYMPVIFIGFICFTAMTTFITCAMISLESKAFNILKSFPIKPFKVIFSKILAAVVIVVPFILFGDFLVLTNLKFTIYEIIMILALSILLPLVAQTIGIIINLKYPRLDAENDTQVIKQSISSTMSVFIGFGIIALTLASLFICIVNGLSGNMIELGVLIVYTTLELLMLLYLKKNANNFFYNN